MYGCTIIIQYSIYIYFKHQLTECHPYNRTIIYQWYFRYKDVTLGRAHLWNYQACTESQQHAQLAYKIHAIASACITGNISIHEIGYLDSADRYNYVPQQQDLYQDKACIVTQNPSYLCSPLRMCVFSLSSAVNPLHFSSVVRVTVAKWQLLTLNS